MEPRWALLPPDGGCGIGHDRVHQPILKGTDVPHVPVGETEHRIPRCIILLIDRLLDELRSLSHGRVMSRRWGPLAMSPLPGIVLAGASPRTSPCHASSDSRQPEHAPGVYRPHCPASS